MSKKPEQLVKMYKDMEKRARRVSAFVVMRGSSHVGTVRLHYPADGMGRLIAYVADWTLDRPKDLAYDEFTRWQKGIASGVGYDKATAAMSGLTIASATIKDEGADWVAQLTKEGYTVLRAI